MAGDNPQNRLARESGEKNIDDSILDSTGNPLIRISCAAAELIPTVQFGNVSIGPISVVRYVSDGDDEHIKNEIRKTQSLCEEAVAEDRKTVQALTRQSAQGRIQS